MWVYIMKLMTRIAVIFISITVISLLLYKFIRRKVVGRIININFEYIGSHDLLTALINRNKLTRYIGELKKK